jgi:outer membrane protein
MKQLFFGLSTLLLTISVAAQENPWKVRFRFTHIAPNESSTTLLDTVSYVDLTEQTVPELDITYMLNQRWGLELILATADHDLNLNFDNQQDPELAPSMRGGTATLLPPTLTAQYFFDTSGDVQFYVGAGVNYTTFIDYSLSEEFAELGIADLQFDDSIGLALNAGFDGYVNDHWHFNLDMKYIDLGTDVDIELNDGSILDTLEVDINPFVFSFGLGYKF